MQSLRVENHSKVAGSFAFPSIQRQGSYSTQSNLNVFRDDAIPVTALITENSDQVFFSRESLIFCYEAVIRTIDSCLQGRYSDFDALTTSNCCHGMSLLATDLLRCNLQLDLAEITNVVREKRRDLECCMQNSSQYTTDLKIPGNLIDLASLYLMHLIKEIDPLKGARTATKNLKSIANISTNLCNKIAHALQKKFSNIVANRYSHYLNSLEGCISGIPVRMWGQYIQPAYLRKDRRGVLYASNLFSMQVSLAHLIRSRSKIAVINDLKDENNNLKGRYVWVLEGNGEDQFSPLTVEEMEMLGLVADEPIVVFTGCVFSQTMEIEDLVPRMNVWLRQFSHLVLACDVYYPQFPRIVDDSEFHNNPIIPKEWQLRKVIGDSAQVSGVSATDPSLFCLTHITPASISQVLRVLKEDRFALPLSFIPVNKASFECDPATLAAYAVN